MKLAELSSTLRNNENAVMYYKEGLSVSPNNQKVLAALAKLYMQVYFNSLLGDGLQLFTCENLYNHILY